MFEKITAQLAPSGAQLIAVSKTKPHAAILDLYQRGHRHFGENRVGELVEKQAALPPDIRWHFIGHLQRNKVKQIAPFVHLIHSVDSPRLLREIERRAARHDRIIDVLLQFHIAEEDSKYGLDLAAAQALLRDDSFAEMKNVRLRGVMGMGTFTDDLEQVRREFRRLQGIFAELKKEFFEQADHFREISMGMSGDYLVAIEEGSTMVRIGTLLFGERN